jgi:hypothetical protein
MRRPAAWWVIVGALAVGCGSQNRPVTQEDMQVTALNDVGELYRGYQVLHRKPPRQTADFQPMEMANPTGLRALKTGEIVVFYNAELPDLGEAPGKGPADTVLAYEKPVPEQGGKVLMLNRTIKTMTADEFKAAPKAGTESSAPAGATSKTGK